MDLGLTRKDTATILGTNSDSLKHWEEQAKTYIRPMFYRAIIDFLGYNPLPEPTTPGAAVRRERLARGWSVRRLAAETGVDAATISRIESDRPRLARRPQRIVFRVLRLGG
jgi:hypothetical protein